MEGATLYQLGVVATISRPPALDCAEALLKQALELEPEEGAATLTLFGPLFTHLSVGLRTAPRDMSFLMCVAC